MYRTLPQRADDTLGYAIAGRVDAAEVAQMQQEIGAAMERNGSIRMLLRIDGLDGVEPTAVWQDLKMTPDYVRRIDRLAVVGDERWHVWTARLADAVADAAHFSPEDEDHAWAWLLGEG